MPIAKLENVDLDYLDEGEGETIVLIHGFCSTKEVNWLNTGWVKLLTENGYRVIAHDNRGHGGSTKFHDEADYSLGKMAGDTLQLLDMLNIKSCHVMGYSMGARISTTLVLKQANRFDRVVLAGNGYNMITSASGEWQGVRDALLAPSLADVADSRGRRFRAFADQTKSDRQALAACVIGAREMFSEEDFKSITNPVLVAIGTEDDLAGSGEKLAELMENASFLPIPDRDHMRSVGDKVYMQGVVDFLN